MVDDRPEDDRTVAGFGPRQTRAADHRPRSHGSVGRNPKYRQGADAAAERRRPSRLRRPIPPRFIARGYRRGRRRAGDRRGLAAGMARRCPHAVSRAAGQHRGDRWACRRASPASRPRPASRGRRARSGAGRARSRRWRNRVAALRGELAGAARAVGEARGRSSTTSNRRRANPPPPPDLSAINERIAQIERATRAQSAEIAQGRRTSRRTTRRCAASWWRPCSTSRFGTASPMPPRWRRRNRSRRIRMH